MPQCVFISGNSRMGKSTFADRLIREFPERSFHYLSFDAVKDMLIANHVFAPSELKLSDKSALVSPSAFWRDCQQRDAKIAPYMEAWADSEMSRGHDVIVNMFFSPDKTSLYTRPDCIPVVFLDTRPVEDQVSMLASIRDTSDSAFNWMRCFDDRQLAKYAESARFRAVRVKHMLIEDLVDFHEFSDYGCGHAAMHDAAMEKVRSLLR